MADRSRREDVVEKLEAWARQHPIEGHSFSRDTLNSYLADIHAIQRIGGFKAIGKLTVDMADLTARLSALTHHLPKQAHWQALLILEAFTLQLVMVFGPMSETPAPRNQTQLTPAEERQRRIHGSRKEFLPDGTVHLVKTTYLHGNRPDDEKTTVDIYDTRDKLLWSGYPKDKPYEYIAWAVATLENPRVASRIDEMQWIGPELSRAMIVNCPPG